MSHSPGTAAPIKSIQPGGGWCMTLELAWARLRRWWLRTVRPGYVRRMAELRQGACPDCPHDIIDPRDLKFFRNVCGYWFKPEDDRFRWRGRLGLARVGLAEIAIFSLICGLVIAVCVAAARWQTWLSWLAWFAVGVLAILWFQIVYFFRDPERMIPGDPAALFSPADGTVTDIGEVDEAGFPGGRALRVGIFLSVFDVHINRMPRTAQVTSLQYFPGKFFDARRKEAATQNEQLWIDLVDVATGRPLRVKQISGLIARRIVCWLKVGDTLAAGERFGMIKFGSRTEVYLPADMPADFAVSVGQQVYGGATILLRFKEQ